MISFEQIMLEGADEANVVNIFVAHIFHYFWKTVYSKVWNCYFQFGFHHAFAWLGEEMTTNKIEVNDLWNPLCQKLGYCPTAPRNHEWWISWLPVSYSL